MNILEKSLTLEVSQHGIATLVKNENNGEQSLISNQAYEKGDLISIFSAGTISTNPTYLTVQTGENIHITLEPEFLQYINHSCDPNVFLILHQCN